MKIALVGFGKMGRLLEERLAEGGHSVAAIIDPFFGAEKTARGNAVYKSIEALKELKGGIDAAIEFTRPDTAVTNLFILAKEKIPAVTGTTGWYDKLPEIGAAVREAGTSLFWAPNFSLGMNLFYLLASYSAEIFDPFAEYDAAGFETHHNKKADSPSGTAKAIAEKVLAKMTRKKKAVYETLNRPPAPEELHFSSLRVGSVPGVHSLVFDSAADTIELTHTLRNRDGLASGAIKAAAWLREKNRAGVFTMEDMLSDILRRN